MKPFIVLALLCNIFCNPVLSQKSLRIKVIDIETKESLSYAVIRNTVTKKSTVADRNGTFTISGPAEVQVSFTGYATKTVALDYGMSEIELSPSGNSLEDVVITSTRNNILQRDLPQRASVITSKNIENTGAKDLTDVLKKTTGLDVIQYPNLLSGVGIRGFRPQFSGINQRTLLLIDGRPAGATNLATVDLSNVETIEVMKGAASALYGSQAMGGVVNIITKKSKGEIAKELTAAYGSYNTSELGVRAGGSLSSRLDFNAALKYYKQKNDITWGNDNFFRNKFGYTAVTDNYRNKNYVIDSIKQLNDVRGDGIVRPYTSYQFTTGNLRLGYDINDNWRVDLVGDFYSAYNVLSPGDYFEGTANQASKNPYRYSSSITVKGQIRTHLLTAKWYSTNEMTDYVPKTSTFATSKTITTFKGFQLQDNIKVKNTSITFGLDRNNSEAKPQSYNATNALEGAPSSPPYGIYSTAGFLNTVSRLLNDKLIVTLGGRYDKIDFEVQQNPYLQTYKAAKNSYGVFSPGAGLKYKTGIDLDLHASIGKAFVTPDAFNVAGYFVSGPGALLKDVGKVNITYGNPDLEPERSTTWDGGISFFRKEWGLDLDITYFSSVITDRITISPTTSFSITPPHKTADGDTVVSTSTYINADNSHMNGVEFGAAFDIGAFNNYEYSFRLFFNATRFFKLEEVIRDKAITTETVFRTKNITNVADLSMNYGLEYAVKGYVTRLSGRWVGNRYDIDNTDLVKRPEIEYAKFMLLDFSTTIPLRKTDKLILQLNNLSDENYYEKRGFNMPGRNFRISYTIAL